MVCPFVARIKSKITCKSHHMPKTASRSSKAGLAELVTQLRGCTRCPKMYRPAVSGGPVWSRVITVGQAPGTKEPVLGRPFAWTAGETLFGWFEKRCGMCEADFRARVYMGAVCPR